MSDTRSYHVWDEDDGAEERAARIDAECAPDAAKDFAEREFEKDSEFVVRLVRVRDGLGRVTRWEVVPRTVVVFDAEARSL